MVSKEFAARKTVVPLGTREFKNFEEFMNVSSEVL
jgi:hypothetical protein